MIAEILAGILLSLSIFFLYLGIRSWRNMREKRFIYLSFVFFIFSLKSIIFIISDFTGISFPIWYYFIPDIAALIILYLTLILR